MSTVTTWPPRSRNEISAMSRAHSQTGENTLSTRVPVIGLRSSFSRSVTANAAAVAPSSASTISVCGSRVQARTSRGRIEAAHRTNGSACSQPQLAPWNSAAARIARSLRGCGYGRCSVS